MDNSKGLFCQNQNSFSLKTFPDPAESMPNTTIAKEQCEGYCGTTKDCWGCAFQCNRTCEWNALTSCYDNPDLEQTFSKALSQKPSKWNHYINNQLFG